MEPIIGTPEARRIETIYVTSVAYDGQMYEFATWAVQNTLITDAPPVITTTELRSGKLKKADRDALAMKVEERVSEMLK